MTYSAEQLKDLLYLVERGCVGRDCKNCMWEDKNRKFFCKILEGKILGIVTKKGIKDGLPPSSHVQLLAKDMIREIIGNEIHK